MARRPAPPTVGRSANGVRRLRRAGVADNQRCRIPGRMTHPIPRPAGAARRYRPGGFLFLPPPPLPPRARVAGLARGLTSGSRPLRQAALFAHWMIPHGDTFRRVAAATSAEARLIDFRVTVVSNLVHAYCEFASGDAVDGEAGAAADAIRAYVRKNCPLRSLDPPAP